MTYATDLLKIKLPKYEDANHFSDVTSTKYRNQLIPHQQFTNLGNNVFYMKPS